jgi:hypothetical protein
MEAINHIHTETEAARVLGLSVATMRAWRQSRRGPRFVRLGRAIRYTPEDLKQFVAANTVDTTPESPVQVAKGVDQ